MPMRSSGSDSTDPTRSPPTPAWLGPWWPYLGWLSIAAVLTWAAVEVPALQRWLDTPSLTGSQWLAAIGLALVSPVLAEGEKALRRRRQTVAEAAR